MKFRISNLLLALFLFTLVLSCNKENNDDETNNPAPAPAVFTPLVTAEGTPVGGSNAATIGMGGGSITSDDGRLQIIFPANALSVDTEISIQPITNFCPGGVGLAYELLPEGLQFSQPVALTFHYTADDILGSAPNALAIATQHADDIWYSLSDITLDEPTSTVSISTTHFSDWALLEGYSISPWEATIEVNEALPLVVYNTPTGPESSDEGITFEPLGAPVPMSIFLDAISWSVNSFPGGTFNDGYVNPESGSSSATYQAPAHIVNMTGNPAAIRAFIDFGGGASISLMSIVTVEELGAQYSLHFQQDYSTLNYTSPFCLLNSGYMDGFDVDITVTAGEVLVSNVSNFTPFIGYSSWGCDCQSMTFGQGSLIEFSNFTAWFDGELLHYDYNFSWTGSDDTYQCPDSDMITTNGTDFSDVDLGSLELPVGEVVTIEQPWGIGTVTVTRVL